MSDYLPTRQPTIIDLGPAALHDMRCALCHRPAVLDINSDTFHPCWHCQSEGWQLVKRRKLDSAAITLACAVLFIACVVGAVVVQAVWP